MILISSHQVFLTVKHGTAIEGRATSNDQTYLALIPGFPAPFRFYKLRIYLLLEKYSMKFFINKRCLIPVITMLLYGLSSGQILFDTHYHENLNVDSSRYDYRLPFEVINNGIDPADTNFNWEITYMEKEEDWNYSVVTSYMAYADPKGAMPFSLGIDSTIEFRMDFAIYETSGTGELHFKVTSVLYPDIKDSVIFKIVSRNTLSVGNLDNQGILIYPNPASDYIQIQTESGAFYEISNLVGQVVQTGEILKPLSFVDLKNLSSGSYFLKIEVSGQIIIKKVLVE
ncbi:MAG: hypothetical protein COA58_02620 [Bacteroidetes bacterium]|nr:MAG: hypothetical protein COA58_02620 [Bacteroidota bacterium]